MAYLSMHRQTNAHLSDLGITADQFVCLDALYDSGRIIQRELAERTSCDPNTLRAMLVLLEKKGDIVRKTSPEDGRALVVQLTAAGRTVTERAFKVLQPLRERIDELFSPKEASALAAQLTRISDELKP